MNTLTNRIGDVEETLEKFTRWLEKFGETSYDHQSYFAGPVGRRAKALYYTNKYLGILAVSPMIFSEAFLPQARRLFWKKLRFAIADAHYAMGFAFLHEATGLDEHYQRSLHFLDVLKKTRSPGWENFCWGYPFDWETREGTVPTGRPMVTVTPYAYDAFAHVHQIDGQEEWESVLKSIAMHMADDFLDVETGPKSATCSYSPFSGNGVINASAYRAALLADASVRFDDDRYWDIGVRNLNFVLENQRPDGSWFYAMDSVRDFVDHYHTCFVLKALARIEKLKGDTGCLEAISKGVEYYLGNLFDEDGLPKPFSRAPRLTVYRNELYDLAEAVNAGVLLEDRIPEIGQAADRVVDNLLTTWTKPDGSFRSRRLMLGWDNVPMHRWAQSQMFRSLASWQLARKKSGLPEGGD